MNKPVITVLVLTVAAVALLALYSFGPLAQYRGGARLNPSSLEPVPSTGATAAAADTASVAFHNRDARENYYTVSFPTSWHVGAGKAPGSYSVSPDKGTLTVELMDVPDNTTLELYILSQEEPRLKESAEAYERVGYEQLQIGGSSAYQLVYRSKVGQEIAQTSRTYISGPDMAAVMTFTANQSDFSSVQPDVVSVQKSFHWENP